MQRGMETLGLNGKRLAGFEATCVELGPGI